MAKFTVIIPYYQKQAGILQRALESVFAQSYQNFDIIIVDRPRQPAEGAACAHQSDQTAERRTGRSAQYGP